MERINFYTGILCRQTTYQKRGMKQVLTGLDDTRFNFTTLRLAQYKYEDQCQLVTTYSTMAEQRWLDEVLANVAPSKDGSPKKLPTSVRNAPPEMRAAIRRKQNSEVRFTPCYQSLNLTNFNRVPNEVEKGRRPKSWLFKKSFENRKSVWLSLRSEC